MKLTEVMFEEVFPEYVHVYRDKISIPIIDTDEINKVGDKLRVSDGKAPLYNQYPHMEMDIDAWYEVRLILNSNTLEPIEIELWAENCSYEDAGIYNIPIDNKEDVMAAILMEMKRCDITFDELKECAE